MAGKGVPVVDRALRGVPDMPRWRNPTLWLLVADFGLAGAATAAYLYGDLAAGWTVAANALAAYLGFTVMHESVHRLVDRNRLVNDAMGWLCAPVFTVTQPTFRAVHLMHHAKTNDPEADPDFSVGEGPAWLRPILMLSPLWEYRVHYYTKRLWRDRWERNLQLGLDALIVVIIAAAAATGHLGKLAVVWLLPAAVSVAVLGYTFDYLPHRPYDSRERFLDTRAYPSPVLNVVLLGQNYHLIHHAWVTIPWFRYQRVFRSVEPDLAAFGARIGGRPTRARTAGAAADR